MVRKNSRNYDSMKNVAKLTKGSFEAGKCSLCNHIYEGKECLQQK